MKISVKLMPLITGIFLMTGAYSRFYENHSGNSAEISWITDSVNVPGVQYHIFHSASVNGNVSFHIYLPEKYKNSNREFPVLYWLHGGARNIQGIEGIPFLASYFHQAMIAEDIPPMLIVFPVGLSFGMWSDSKDGSQPVESMLVTDLIPFIDSTFRTINSRKGRLIEGWSMGGYGAARIGLKHHDLFQGFSMMGSGPLQLNFLEDGPIVPLQTRLEIFKKVFGNDQAYFEELSPWYIAESVSGMLPDDFPIRQIIGVNDPVIHNNRNFQAHLVDLNIPHTYIEVPGVDHNAVNVLLYLKEQGWDFYHQVFGNQTISSGSAQHKTKFQLYQNYPNPFRHDTTIRFAIPMEEKVRLEILDITGKIITVLKNQVLSEGEHHVHWNASGMPPGFYTCRLTSENGNLCNQMLLINF